MKQSLPAAAALFGFGLTYGLTIALSNGRCATCRTEYTECVFLDAENVQGCLEMYRACAGECGDDAVAVKPPRR